MLPPATNPICHQEPPVHLPLCPARTPTAFYSPEAPSTAPLSVAVSLEPVSTLDTSYPLPHGPERKLMIANGKVITFTENQLRDPPGISFATDLEGLNTQWDDTSHHWGGTAALKIKGEPIAIVYWQAIYSRHRLQEWTRVKQKWGEWQVSFRENLSVLSS